ncbi:MAG: hypothetical protein MUF75_03325 [Bacteroidia bacterium]|jgi:divalent metal cation (Fe/Co/Zn/Cd) transporter|nr:hypothetical protein [Bacteroidia bacterium]
MVGTSYIFVFLLLSTSIYGFFKINSAASAIAALLILGLSIIYFFELISDISTPSLLNNPFFWINLAFLIYFSGVLFVFIFSDIILDSNIDKSVKNLWKINYLLYSASSILFTVSIIKWKKIKL